MLEMNGNVSVIQVRPLHNCNGMPPKRMWQSCYVANIWSLQVTVVVATRPSTLAVRSNATCTAFICSTYTNRKSVEQSYSPIHTHSSTIIQNHRFHPKIHIEVQYVPLRFTNALDRSGGLILNWHIKGRKRITSVHLRVHAHL